MARTLHLRLHPTGASLRVVAIHVRAVYEETRSTGLFVDGKPEYVSTGVTIVEFSSGSEDFIRVVEPLHEVVQMLENALDA